MSNPHDFTYIEAAEFPAVPVIHIPDVKEFIRFAKKNDAKFIFKIVKDEKTAEFYFPLKDMVYKTAGNSYLTLADLVHGQQNDFPTAGEFYDAAAKGFKTYQDYKDFKNVSPEDKPELEAAYAKGFGEGFKSFLEKYEGYRSHPPQSVMPGTIDDPLKLYRYALKKGITNFEQFEKVYDAGYPDLASFNDAHKKGFKESREYYEALSKGFSDPKELTEANKNKILTKKEFDQYRILRDANEHRNYFFDELQLLQTLAKAENGKLFSFDEMMSMLEKAQEPYRQQATHGDKKILPVWYKHHLERGGALLNFLHTNGELKKFGYFNAEKKAFKVFKPSAVKILVDGSNVAHNNKGPKIKPELRYIRLVIQELHEWKFKNVTVISDFNLITKVKDKHLVKELEKECNYRESPDKKEADEYLIKTMETDYCGIVTRDKYRDWVHDFKWLPQKLETLRIEFEITRNDKVILRGMDKFRESTEREG